MSGFLGAVIGRPIAHSLSPLLYRAALASLHLPGTYTRLAAGSVAAAVDLAAALDISTLNVTAPFKEAAAAFATTASPEVARLGAANTLLFSGQGLHAENTDVAGVRSALVAMDPTLQQGPLVLFGAGGAAKAVLFALREHRPPITIVNRDPSRAEALQQLFPEHNICVLSFSSSELQGRMNKARLVIDATAAPELPIPRTYFTPGQVVWSARYHHPALEKLVDGTGVRFVDGRTWLLYQACRVVELALGQPAPVADMAQALENRAQVAARHIVLTGMMGSGKSTLGPLLAQNLGLQFVDLDALIEARSGRSVATIFASSGEDSFRALETEALREALATVEPQVISVGGGAILAAQNRELLSARAFTIFLYASVAELVQRVGGNTTHRPLLVGEDLSVRLSEIFAARKGHYLGCADLVVDTRARSCKAIVAEIIAAGCTKENL